VTRGHDKQIRTILDYLAYELNGVYQSQRSIPTTCQIQYTLTFKLYFDAESSTTIFVSLNRLLFFLSIFFLINFFNFRDRKKLVTPHKRSSNPTRNSHVALVFQTRLSTPNNLITHTRRQRVHCTV